MTLPFRHGRPPFDHTPDPNRGGAHVDRPDSNREEPTVGDWIAGREAERRHITADQIEAEAREAADDGHRDAIPQLVAMWGEVLRVGQPVAAGKASSTVTHEEASAAAPHLLNVRDEVMEAAKALCIEGNIDLHLRLNAIVNLADEVGAILAGRWGE